MHSEGYSSRSVCLSVRLSVDPYSGTTRYEAAHERYQRLQNYANLKIKMAIFLKRLCSRDMAWKQAKKPNYAHVYLCQCLMCDHDLRFCEAIMTRVW